MSWQQVSKQLYTGNTSTFQRWWKLMLRLPFNRLQVVYTPNPEQVMLAHKDERFAKLLLASDVLLADGIGLILADRWERLWGRAGKRKPLTRIQGSDVVEWWLRTNTRVPTLLLGGYAGVAQKVAERFDPTHSWCVATEGYKDAAQPTSEEEESVRRLVQQHEPKVVLVAFGAPKQEMWVEEHRRFLEKSGVRMVMVCGGSFDYLAGRAFRAPKVMRWLGFEWLFRLLTQPWRAKRQGALLEFVRHVMR